MTGIVRRGSTWLGFVAACGALAIWTPLHQPLAGQQTAPAVQPPPTPSGSSRVQIHVDSATATVGLALYIPGGSAADPVGQEGTSTLLAATIGGVMTGQTRSIAADARFVVDQGGVTVLGRATPEALPTLIRTLQRAVFENPVPLVSLEQARADLLGRLRFQAGAPVRAFHEAVSDFVFRAFPGWGHTESGTLTSVEAINLESLAAAPPFGRADRDRATLAVVGPVDPDSVGVLARGLLGTAERTPSEGVAAHAWTTAETLEVAAEITSTWVAVALPVRADTPGWRIELLAHHIDEVLRPDPPRPGLVSPQTRIVRPGGLPIILVTFAISPERAATWVDRVLATARLESDAPPDERFFRWQRRRFRTVWLNQRARPEQRAARLARGWAGNMPDAIEAPFDIGVWRTDLEDVSRALGQPRVVIYGPALGRSEALDSVGLNGLWALDPN